MGSPLAALLQRLETWYGAYKKCGQFSKTFRRLRRPPLRRPPDRGTADCERRRPHRVLANHGASPPSNDGVSRAHALQRTTPQNMGRRFDVVALPPSASQTKTHHAPGGSGCVTRRAGAQKCTALPTRPRPANTDHSAHGRREQPRGAGAAGRPPPPRRRNGWPFRSKLWADAGINADRAPGNHAG